MLRVASKSRTRAWREYPFTSAISRETDKAGKITLRLVGLFSIVSSLHFSIRKIHLSVQNITLIF